MIDSKVFTNGIDTPPFSFKTQDEINQMEGVAMMKKYVENRLDSNLD